MTYSINDIKFFLYEKLCDIWCWFLIKIKKLEEPQLSIGDYVINCNRHPAVVIDYGMVHSPKLFKFTGTRYEYDLLDLVTGLKGSCSENYCINKNDKIDSKNAIEIADAFRCEGYVSGAVKLGKFYNPNMTEDECKKLFEYYESFIREWRDGDQFEGRIPGRMETKPR